MPVGPRLGGVRNRRQLERRLDTPYSRNQYQPFQWPATSTTPSSSSSSSVAPVSLGDNFSGVMAATRGASAHQLRHKPRTRAATAAAAAMGGDVGDSLFPGLSSSLPPLPPVVTPMTGMSVNGMTSLTSMAAPTSLPPLPALDMPPLSPSFGSSPMPSVKFESLPSTGISMGMGVSTAKDEFTPFSPSAGFMDMRDFQLPMSPYSTASAIDDNLSVKSEESSYRDESESVNEDDDVEHMEDPNDAALAVASVLVRAHEAGYDMDSLTTQIQIALLK
jgi:hypothetical protein